MDISKIKELIEAAKPFLSGYTVDETTGTFPLMERLEEAIDAVEEEMEANHGDTTDKNK
jgi:hypothetical protein